MEDDGNCFHFSAKVTTPFGSPAPAGERPTLFPSASPENEVMEKGGRRRVRRGLEEDGNGGGGGGGDKVILIPHHSVAHVLY